MSLLVFNVIQKPGELGCQMVEQGSDIDRFVGSFRFGVQRTTFSETGLKLLDRIDVLTRVELLWRDFVGCF